MNTRNKLKAAALVLSEHIGRYANWEVEELETRHAEPVAFSGDIPSMAGHEMNQYRVVLAKPRPLIAHAAQLTYTNRGMAWVAGTLQRRFSFQEVGLRHVLEKPGAPEATYREASILQAQTLCTYGDWMSEHVAVLARAKQQGGIVEPLLLPGWWFRKPYVQRDIAAMGIRAEAVDDVVHIDRATVINKTRNGHYWTREEVSAVMSVMKIHPQPAARGSAIYLSRRGEKGEGPKREINNEVTEAAMVLSGVRVVRTCDCDQAAYIALANEAETVFTDHGSAGYNMMYWKPRRIVEFFSPDYWDSAFLFLADSLGISDYHLWQISPETTVDDITRRIRALLSTPAAQAT